MRALMVAVWLWSHRHATNERHSAPMGISKVRLDKIEPLPKRAYRMPSTVPRAIAQAATASNASSRLNAAVDELHDAERNQINTSSVAPNVHHAANPSQFGTSSPKR